MALLLYIKDVHILEYLYAFWYYAESWFTICQSWRVCGKYNVFGIG